MARKSLKERFRANTIIIEELESSVVTGPKVRDGGGPELLALSDKKQLSQGPVATQVYNELGKYNETATHWSLGWLPRKRESNSTQG